MAMSVANTAAFANKATCSFRSVSWVKTTGATVLTIAEVNIAKVELLDGSGKTVLEELGSYEPKIWNSDAYESWNEKLISSGSASKVSYNLTEPDWEKVGAGEPWKTYSMTFHLRVTIKVAGQTVVLLSDEIMREPEIVT